MPKIICHMRSGYPFTINSGIQIPGEPTELECSAYQAECIKADCRIVTMDAAELKAHKAEKKAAAAALKKKQADKAAKAKAGEESPSGDQGGDQGGEDSSSE